MVENYSWPKTTIKHGVAHWGVRDVRVGLPVPGAEQLVHEPLGPTAQGVQAQVETQAAAS